MAAIEVDPGVIVRTPDELLAAVPHMLGFDPLLDYSSGQPVETLPGV